MLVADCHRSNIKILKFCPNLPHAEAERRKEDEKTESLKGWQPIAIFLGQTVSVAEPWAHQAMPVQRNGQVRTRLAGRIGPLVWGGNQLASRVQIASEDLDLSSELKRGLSYVQKCSQEKQARASGLKQAARLRS